MAEKEEYSSSKWTPEQIEEFMKWSESDECKEAFRKSIEGNKEVEKAIDSMSHIDWDAVRNNYYGSPKKVQVIA